MASSEGRRSFLLGITLNELSFIMFFLLMIISSAVLQKAKRDLAQETEQNVQLQADIIKVKADSDADFKRLQLLESRLMQAGGFATKPSEQALDALFSRLQEATAGADLQRQLATLQDYKRLSETLARKGLTDGSAQALEQLLQKAEATAHEQQLLKGRLAYMQNKLKANGLDHPPCWADAQTGAVEYLYNMTLYEQKIRVEAAWPKHRQADVRLIPGAQQLAGKMLTQQQLERQVKPVFAWSKAHNCRHFVRIKDDPKTSKQAFKRQMLAIEVYFYKYLQR